MTVSDLSSLFGTLPVAQPMARALAAMRYETPTPIQEQVIPPMRQGRDVLGQAQTGTGKTAGFGIPLIEGIDPTRRLVQAIVLVPTRELCLQVADELTRLSAHAGLRVIAVYGGVGLGRQTEALQRGAQVVVGTPGRVEDLLQRGSLRLNGVRLVILDEADRMLDVGFLPAIERILRRTPAERQTALFSATIPQEIMGLAHRQMRDPVTIAVDPERATVDEIEQRFERVPDGDKLSALRAYLDQPSTFLALVFRRTTYKADRLTRDLERAGYKAAVLHGRRSQNQRERVLADLKACRLQVLVATDIAARGLDITGLTHVFNFDLPDTPETYVHRIGRTGRAGETGTAITLIGPEDDKELRQIERYLAGQRSPEANAPQGQRKGTPSGRSRPSTGSNQPRRDGRPEPSNSPGQARPSQGRPSTPNTEGANRRPRRWPSRQAS
ncbi:MAG: DEAD/DEAH box helicase [Chloroflexota bacterium]|nr:DEAD/DEAH box helicase [Chloroflexota bacterium]